MFDHSLSYGRPHQETDQLDILITAAECTRDLVARAMLWPDTRRELAEILPRFVALLVPWLSNDGRGSAGPVSNSFHMRVAQ